VQEIGGRLAGSWPALAAVAQQRIEPSRLRARGHGGSEFAVEVRPLAYVLGWQEVAVGEHSIAKLAPSSRPETLNNITCGGSYAPVVRVVTADRRRRPSPAPEAVASGAAPDGSAPGCGP
jgi:hypothetical protein